jgi:hypothetical protein
MSQEILQPSLAAIQFGGLLIGRLGRQQRMGDGMGPDLKQVRIRQSP